MAIWRSLTMINLIQYALPTDGACPVNPPCTCGGHSLSCYYKGISSIPRFTPVHPAVSVYFIDLHSNVIRRIEASAFANLSLANDVDVFINFDRNPVQYVDDLAFNGLQNNSVEIEMSITRLTSLPKAFGVLKNLRALTTDVALDSSVMMDMGASVQYLSLWKVARWPVGLRYANQLLHLEVRGVGRVQGNRTLQLPPDAFTGFERSLKDFVFYGPGLSESPDAICSLQNLTKLTLGDFHLAPGVSIFPSCHRPLTGVHSLSVFNVQLGSVANISEVFPSLTSLTLNNDALETLADGLSLPSITLLQLSHNKFSRIPLAIRNFRQLETLIMDNNKITSLEKNSFSNLFQLTTLILDHNPISSIAEDTFRNTPRLTEFHINYANLTTVPKAIRPLGSLSLDMHVNRLTCSCDLVWLVLWPGMKSGEVQINARCYPGNTDLSHFISTELRKCEGVPIG